MAIKFDRKALIKAAKVEEEPKKANYTFRLDKELYKAFKEQCKKDDIKPTKIIEEFLKGFTKP